MEDKHNSSFLDSQGRKWTFVCNTFTLAKVKRETGVDLARAVEKGADEVIGPLLEDVSLLFDVVCSLLSKEMTSAGVDAESLGYAIDDEDISIEMVQAMIRGVINFSPRSRRDPMMKAFNKLWGLTKEKATIKANQAVLEMDRTDWNQLATNIVGNSTSSISEDVSIPPDS